MAADPVDRMVDRLHGIIARRVQARRDAAVDTGVRVLAFDGAGFSIHERGRCLRSEALLPDEAPDATAVSSHLSHVAIARPVDDRCSTVRIVAIEPGGAVDCSSLLASQVMMPFWMGAGWLCCAEQAAGSTALVARQPTAPRPRPELRWDLGPEVTAIDALPRGSDVELVITCSHAQFQRLVTIGPSGCPAVRARGHRLRSWIVTALGPYAPDIRFDPTGPDVAGFEITTSALQLDVLADRWVAVRRGLSVDAVVDARGKQLRELSGTAGTSIDLIDCRTDGLVRSASTLIERSTDIGSVGIGRAGFASDLLGAHPETGMRPISFALGDGRPSVIWLSGDDETLEGFLAGRPHPLIVTAYSAFGAWGRPRFEAWRRAWADLGGLVATPVLGGATEHASRGAGRANLRDSAVDLDRAVAACAAACPAAPLGMLGTSWGALLAGAVALRTVVPIRGLAVEAGILDLCNWRSLRGSAHWGAHLATAPHEVAEHCPCCLVARAEAPPPIAVMYSTDDGLVDPRHSTRFITAAQGRSAASMRSITVVGGDHLPALGARLRARASLLTYFRTVLQEER